jgi:hypothetical protein
LSAVAKPLKAPFPAFGGKSTVSDMVWSRFGDVRNYIEPFAFSAAILLRRPHPGTIETINDLNAYVPNFWRAVQRDPEAVAAHADWPVSETDLHARHRWLVQSAAANDALQRVKDDPEFYDAKIAGWWCWGACCWIGSGWCDATRTAAEQIPMLCTDGAGGRGVTGISQKIPTTERCAGGGKGINGEGTFAVKRPILAGEHANGKGVNCFSTAKHNKRPRAPGSTGNYMPGVINDSPEVHGRPQLADQYARGRGVNGNDSAGTCGQRRAWLTDWMYRLADRLRPVRICCGAWDRVCDSESTLTRLGTTGVFLDPPYRKNLACGTENRSAHLYANDKLQDVGALCDDVQAWCLKWGDVPDMRIAVCGLEGEYPAIDAAGWEKVAWKSRGGYGNRTGKGKEQRERERIWFSPNCVNPETERTLWCPAPEVP